MYASKQVCKYVSMQVCRALVEPQILTCNIEAPSLSLKMTLFCLPHIGYIIGSRTSSLLHWGYLIKPATLTPSQVYWDPKAKLTALMLLHHNYLTEETSLSLKYWGLSLRLLFKVTLSIIFFFASEFLFHGSSIPSSWFLKYACHACNFLQLWCKSSYGCPLRSRMVPWALVKYQNDQNICSLMFWGFI